MLYNLNVTNFKPKHEEFYINQNNQSSLDYLKKLAEKKSLRELEVESDIKTGNKNPRSGFLGSFLKKEKSPSPKISRKHIDYSKVNQKNKIIFDPKTHNGINILIVICLAKDFYVVDQEAFTKDDTEGLMTKLMLKCNFIRNKDFHNNTRLKSGAGKLMQTNNMSIAEFEKRYAL